MNRFPKSNIEKLERILNAWNAIAPESKFGGLEKAEFESMVNAARAARATIEDLENQLTVAMTLRDRNDEIALRMIPFIKNSVLADPALGENSALYEAFGYVRKDDRKSGLTRKTNTVAVPE